MTLRILFAGLALLSAAPGAVQAQTPSPAVAAPAQIATTHLTVPAPDGRTIDMSVWTAPDEKGVVVFSHGWGGGPAGYDRIFSAWAAHGFTVIAPLHVDSQQHPRHADYDHRQVFLTRIMDLYVARGLAHETHPGKPLIVAGHSFGSLMSMMEAGAVTVAGPLGDPDVRGVISFSSTGELPTVIRDTTWDGLNRPLLMITGQGDGTADGDWTIHRVPYDRSPAGDKTLMVFTGADHELVANASDDQFALLVEATEDFLDAYALNDAAAKARLNALPSSDAVNIERR